MKRILPFIIYCVLLHTSSAQEYVFKKDYSAYRYQHLQLNNGKIAILISEQIRDTAFVSSFRKSSVLYLLDSNGTLLDQKEILPNSSVGCLHEMPNGNIVASTYPVLCSNNCSTTFSSPITEIDVSSGSIVTVYLKGFDSTTCALPSFISASGFAGAYQVVLTNDDVIFFNNNGDSLTSFVNPVTYNKLLPLSPTRMIVSNPVSTFALDSTGNVLATVTNQVSSSFIKLSNSRYIAIEGHKLVKRNELLGLIKQVSLSYMASREDAAIYNDHIYFMGKSSGTSYRIIRLDTNLVKLDSVQIHMQGNILFEEIIPYSNHFFLLGKEAYVSNAAQMVLKKYNYTNAGLPLFAYDVAVKQFRTVKLIDTVTSPPPASQNIHNLTYQVYAQIKNQGISTLDTVVISAESYHSIPFTSCYLPYVSKTFYSLGLAPGHSAEVYIGDISYTSVEMPLNIDLCVWADMPEYKIDQLYMNNRLCKNLSTDVTEISTEEVTFDLYPNPLDGSEILHLSVHGTDSLGMYYVIHDMRGRKIMQHTITQAETSIYLNNLNGGIYFLEIKKSNHYYPAKRFVVK